MNDGDKVKLVPGISSMKDSRVSGKSIRLAETLRAMSEEVTIISMYNGTGNAKVRDNKGIVFYCHPNDLTNFTDHFSDL